MLSRLTAPVAVALDVSTMGSGAFAEGTMQQRRECEPDVFRLCLSSIPDVGAIVACLRGNEARLGEPCREVMFPDRAGRDEYERLGRIRSGEAR